MRDKWMYVAIVAGILAVCSLTIMTITPNTSWEWAGKFGAAGWVLFLFSFIFSCKKYRDRQRTVRRIRFLNDNMERLPGWYSRLSHDPSNTESGENARARATIELADGKKLGPGSE